MTKASTKRPTHRAYAVTKRNEEAFWHEIGAVWAHEDGDGFTLKLHLLPLDGSDIVIRKPKADKGGAQ